VRNDPRAQKQRGCVIAKDSCLPLLSNRSRMSGAIGIFCELISANLRAEDLKELPRLSQTGTPLGIMNKRSRSPILAQFLKLL